MAYNDLNLTASQIKRFQRVVYSHYSKHKRDFPWRRTRDPYRIMVSEVMLQQTQVSRVQKSYGLFLKKFSTISVLNNATLHEVMKAWSGLGYNRRALALKKIASIVLTRFHGKIPHDPALLQTFPGIGQTTAAAISAFAFNQKVIFIETNIRSVFLDYFFRDKDNVHDSTIYPLIEKTLDRFNPRRWYYALMDYGAHLKLRYNPNRKSTHYRKQPCFKGSRRQLRGRIIACLTNTSGITKQKLYFRLRKLGLTASRALFDSVLQALIVEGLVIQKGSVISIT